MTRQSIEAGIREALANVRTIDPHTHLRPDRPGAGDLADIVLYHHVWIELISAGMAQNAASKNGMCQELESPEMEPRERLRNAAPYLPLIRSTTAGLLLRWIFEDLLGEPFPASSRDLEGMYDAVLRRCSAPSWQETVLRDRCGIDHSITVEGVDVAPFSEALSKAREWAPVSFVSGKRPSGQILAGFERELGRPIRDARSYREFLVTDLHAVLRSDPVFIGMWLLPYTSPRLADDADVTDALRRIGGSGDASPEQLGGLSYFGCSVIFEELQRTGPFVVQLIAGAEVLAPHRSLTHWAPELPGSIGRLAAGYPRLHFNLSAATDLYSHDLAVLAKHVPNCSVAGFWWHTFYPRYIRASLEARLDAVPMNKIIAFFSDAYHAEWCYPKLKLVKQIVGDVLVERVERGWFEIDTAYDLIERMFHSNAREIYGL